MGKIAFVFAGQGAQAPGMGKEFYESSEAARKVFEAADAVRPGTSVQCFEGTPEELQITENTQPCLFSVEMAIAAALEEAGIKADMTAGFSLGELSALTYSGVFSLQTGLELVKQRGRFMQLAAEKSDTSMAAVIKLTDEQVIELCSGFNNIYPVNFNCPGQISCSGDAEEMAAFAEAVKEAGGRAKVLKVNGAFHCPYMSEAAEAFGKVLADVEISSPLIPVYADKTAMPYTDDVKDTLASQIDNPVRWEALIRNMIKDGVDTFVEIGPGKTLTGLIKRISSDVRLFNVSVPEELEKFTAEV
ncbi:MAG: ACP S-malonyltransferase [Parasporobacterium sp.]|nr:ACP S-malonyltransferase [Parasporobacterium sp.]